MATNNRSSGHSKRHPPPHIHTRPQRPPHKRTPSHKGQSKSGQPRPKDEEDDLMAASFLQFCATCEKQIVTPLNSILYCSESCRRRDQKSSYYPTDYSPPTSPLSSFTLEDHSDLPAPREIVSPRSPTAPSNRSSIVMSEVSDTEPVQSEGRIPLRREDSEAARYLRQFQSTQGRSSIDFGSSRRPSRPNYHRSSASTTAANTPSLSHTPASTVSMSIPYTPALSYSRPLPPRHNPQSSSFGAARDIGLVTPCTTFPTTAPSSLTNYTFKAAPSAMTSMGMAAGEMRYEKKVTLPSTPSGPGSLGQLFRPRS